MDLIGRLAQFPGLSKIDAYARLVDCLPASFQLDRANSVAFPYDWRFSCAVNARLLADRICPATIATRCRSRTPHVGLPTAEAVLRTLRHLLTATPKAEQAEPARARLAIGIPDLVEAGVPVEVRCEVAEGDPDIPLLVGAEPVEGARPPMVKSPRDRDGELVAVLDGVASW